MAAFRRLNAIVEELKSFNLNPESAKGLKAVIDNLRYYYNGWLKYEIGETSPCGALCLQWALSDPKNKAFSKACDHGGHVENSWHIDYLTTMIQAVAGALDSCLEHGMDRGEWREYSIDINIAYKNIWKFHGHLMRCINQNTVVSQLMNAGDGRTAIVVIDNPMVCTCNKTDFFHFMKNK